MNIFLGPYFLYEKAWIKPKTPHDATVPLRLFWTAMCEAREDAGEATWIKPGTTPADMGKQEHYLKK